MSLWSRLFGQSAKPKIVAHIALDGAIRVFEAPTSDGWQVSEDQRAGDGYTAMVLKYQRGTFALLAKIYTIDADRTPPEHPQTTDWRAAFASLFSTISSLETRETRQLTMKSELPAMEAVLDGIGADPAEPLRIRERRSVLAREQFIVTAIGPTAAFAAAQDEVDRWFQTSAFVPVDDSSA
jgi:hypothetical protein